MARLNAGGSAVGTVTGSGVAGQIAFFSGASVIAGDEGLLFDSATNGLIHGTGADAFNISQHAHASGSFSADRDAQTSELVARVITTNATPTEVPLDGGTTFIATEDDKAYLFRVSVVAQNTAAQETAGYTLEFVFDRASGVATSRISGITKNVVHEDIAAWDVTVTADTTNGRPAITVTGQALTTIHWVARIEMTEVG